MPDPIIIKNSLDKAVYNIELDGITRLGFTVLGPSQLNYNPVGVAAVEYFDPYSDSRVVQFFPVGGSFGATEIYITTGNFAGDPSREEIRISVFDSADYPFAFGASDYPLIKHNEGLNKILFPVATVDGVYTGFFGVSGYQITQIPTGSVDQANVFQIVPTANYPAGFLESQGVYADTPPAGRGL